MKKGITISTLVVTVIVMFMLVTTTAVVGTRAIQTASYEEFTSKITRVSNDVNEYVIDNGTLPTTFEVIAKEGLSNELKAEINKNNDDANNLFVIDMSKLRTESVNIGKGTVENLDVFVVAENTNNVYYLKGVKYKGETYHGITLLATADDNVPAKWAENVVAIVDGVPIPKGFVASSATGESTKAGGLVIYEGTNIVTDANVDVAREERNQFVWVPVDKDTFSTASTQFKRTDYLNNPSKVVSSDGAYNNLGTANVYWEIELDENNIPKGKTLLSDYITDSDLDYISEYTIEEVQAMYASVKEYGGFYIARYEAGGNEIDATTKFGRGTLSITMGKYPYNGVKWGTSLKDEELEGGAVTLARSIYPNNSTNTTGVVSILTYGVQWDRTLDWIRSVKGTSFSLTNSSQYGNYANTSLAATDFNLNAKFTSIVYNAGSSITGYFNTGTWTDATSFTVRSGKYLMTTGALQKANLCNIYDMAGNVCEWTMECYSSSNCVNRGGTSDYDGSARSIAYRNNRNATDLYANYGFRPTLYIKQ